MSLTYIVAKDRYVVFNYNSDLSGEITIKIGGSWVKESQGGYSKMVILLFSMIKN